MSLLSLSFELIEEIAFYLRGRDIFALALSSRRLHDIFVGSIWLQYAYRTEQAGVYDPLHDLARCPIIDRVEALKRWEAAWGNPGKYLAAGPRLDIPAPERGLLGPYFLRDDYLFAMHQQEHTTDLRQPALFYVDLRDALCTGQHSWRQILYPQGSIVITQAFSIEQDDLVVSVLRLPRHDGGARKTVLRFMSLEMGGAHPLAREYDFQLDSELSVNLDARVDIMGDQIVLANPRREAIYLVDWKQGKMTAVHHTPKGKYEGAIAVLSPDLMLLLKRDPPCLELCRVAPGERGAGNSNSDGYAPSGSLHVVRSLALPAFHLKYQLHTAYMQTDRHAPHQSDPETPHQQQRPCPTRAPAALTFHSAPEEMVVGITFLLRTRPPYEIWKKVVTTISHRALFALADTTSRSCHRQTSGDGGREQQDSDGGGTKTVPVPVPWERWGPRAARVITPPTFHRITAHAGQRWLSIEDGKLVVRDFSAARVRRAHARARAGGGGGETAATAQAQARISGGSGGFGQDVVSGLPFLESREYFMGAKAREGDVLLTDGRRLISFVRVAQGQPPTFEVYVLEDKDDKQEQMQEWEWEELVQLQEWEWEEQELGG